MITLNELKMFFNLEDVFVTITGDGTWATVTHENHNYKTGDFIEIKSSTSYNGIYNIKRISTSQYKFLHATIATNQDGVIAKYDKVLTLILNSSIEFVNNYCQIVFGETASAVETYDIKDCEVMLKRGYVDVVTKVEIKEDEGSYSDITDYKLYDDRIVLHREDFLKYKGYKNLRVTYTCKTAPSTVQKAVMDICEYKFRNWNDKNINLISKNIAGDNYQYEKNIPQNILDSLIQYRRYFIGSK